MNAIKNYLECKNFLRRMISASVKEKKTHEIYHEF